MKEKEVIELVNVISDANRMISRCKIEMMNRKFFQEQHKKRVEAMKKLEALVGGKLCLRY